MAELDSPTSCSRLRPVRRAGPGGWRDRSADNHDRRLGVAGRERSSWTTRPFFFFLPSAIGPNADDKPHPPERWVVGEGGGGVALVEGPAEAGGAHHSGSCSRALGLRMPGQQLENRRSSRARAAIGSRNAARHRAGLPPCGVRKGARSNLVVSPGPCGREEDEDDDEVRPVRGRGGNARGGGPGLSRRGCSRDLRRTESGSGQRLGRRAVRFHPKGGAVSFQRPKGLPEGSRCASVVHGATGKEARTRSRRSGRHAIRGTAICPYRSTARGCRRHGERWVGRLRTKRRLTPFRARES